MPKYKLSKPWWDNVKLHQAGSIVVIEGDAGVPDGAVEVADDVPANPQPEEDPTAGPRADRRIPTPEPTTEVPDVDGDGKPDEPEPDKPKRRTARSRR